MRVEEESSVTFFGRGGVEWPAQRAGEESVP
jgi:hypothetical protein